MCFHPLGSIFHSALPSIYASFLYVICHCIFAVLLILPLLFSFVSSFIYSIISLVKCFPPSPFPSFLPFFLSPSLLYFLLSSLLFFPAFLLFFLPFHLPSPSYSLCLVSLSSFHPFLPFFLPFTSFVSTFLHLSFSFHFPLKP